MAKDKDQGDHKKEYDCFNGGKRVDHGDTYLKWREVKPQSQYYGAYSKGSAKRELLPYQDNNQDKYQGKFDKGRYVEQKVQLDGFKEALQRLFPRQGLVAGAQSKKACV